MSKKRIALFGLGHHAQRIYYPLFKEYARKLNVELSLVVDLQSSQTSINNFINTQNYFPKNTIYLPNDREDDNRSVTYDLRNVDYRLLSHTVKHLNIDGAIISTEPLAHKAYANFCLEHNLNILMDKPITTQPCASTHFDAALDIYHDYNELKDSYEKAKVRSGDISFSIVTQRRFHPAYTKIKELVDEVSRRVNIPITSIHSYHSDGEWRMPFEMADQSYHSYNEGYGKLSHSGYHSIDTLLWLVQSSYKNCQHDKMYDRIDINSTFIKPSDLLEQFTENDFRKLFGENEYNAANPYHGDFENLQQIMNRCGEVDASVRALFKNNNNDTILTTATLNLQHNGFSNRSWLSNHGRNLYKGNGRVRHESHVIQQGPFQSIQLHAYQSKFDTSEGDDTRHKVGGIDHCDVTVYRNPLVTSDDVGTFTQFSIKDFDKMSYMKGYSHGHQEDSRANAFFEFIDRVTAEKDVVKRGTKKSKSDMLSHELSVGVLSAIYQSHCLQRDVSVHRKDDAIIINSINSS